MVALVIEGVFITLPWYGRIRQAASAKDDEAAAAAVEAMMSTPRHLATLALAVGLWSAVIYVMVAKPALF